ncbi:hypothetical protein Vafri_4618 [Volvox africanus]|uniref:Uncharacterized protein n=1 Tax=Volvox africanus TaxID=51714 RepID=A0A8J4EVF2_9CHLO|nr:hypothetical protein Vafri_4618 [Volvox africanus]
MAGRQGSKRAVGRRGLTALLTMLAAVAAYPAYGKESPCLGGNRSAAPFGTAHRHCHRLKVYMALSGATSGVMDRRMLEERFEGTWLTVSIVAGAVMFSAITLHFCRRYFKRSPQNQEAPPPPLSPPLSLRPPSVPLHECKYIITADGASSVHAIPNAVAISTSICATPDTPKLAHGISYAIPATRDQVSDTEEIQNWFCKKLQKQHPISAPAGTSLQIPLRRLDQPAVSVICCESTPCTDGGIKDQPTGA